MSGLHREAVVDLDAIAGNVETLRATVGTKHLMAVVKANGYGHGALPVARAALDGGADWLGLVDIAEALELRGAGISAPLLAWLHGHEEDFRMAVQSGVDVGISSLDQLERAASAASGDRIAHVHLKLDTGLHRNGVPPEQWEKVVERAAELERAGGIRVRGLFSHLANASPDDDADQVAAFAAGLQAAEAAGLTPEVRHLASTSAALALPDARFDLVRTGIGIYGLSPFEGRPSAELGLVPALELASTVVAVKRVPAGGGVSYGYRFRAESDTTVALVPLGYGDGIPRSASGRGPVGINGHVHTIAGTIAMDQVLVDVGDADVRVGDRAVFFGDPASGVPSVDDWARASDSINYEIVTRLGNRITRTYRGGSAG